MIPLKPVSSASLPVPGSPFLSCSASARDTREGRKADGSSGGWHQSQAICSRLPPAWVAATRPQPAPAPLTSRQRALTLLVCVVKSSQYSSLESVNSSVPCPLSLSQRSAVTATLPRWVCLSSSPSLAGVWRAPVTFWEEAWSGFSVMGQDLYRKYLKDVKKRKPGDWKIGQMWAVVEV